MTLANVVQAQYKLDPGPRHHISENKHNKEIRLYLQNPNGVLNKEGKLDDCRAYLALQEWQVDLIALPETIRTGN